jgi:glycosyltransferase involved in cell wall biosynthesis
MCGAQSRELLPGFLKSFSVCLVPYKFNNYTKNCFPLKIHEYLASGKPVVASALSAIRDYSEVMYFSATKEEFLGNIRIAMFENDNPKRDKRIQLASHNTWENRILSMEKILSELKLI